MQKIANLKNLQNLLNKNSRVVCDFYADWCGPCKMIGPKFEQLSKDQKYNNITFAQIDVDEADDITSKYKIESIPTFITFHNAVELDRFSTADPEMLETSLDQLLEDRK